MFKDYTMNQLVLPIDLEVSLQENDIAFHIHHLVESIPKEAFRPFFKNNGCPAYNPRGSPSSSQIPSCIFPPLSNPLQNRVKPTWTRYRRFPAGEVMSTDSISRHGKAWTVSSHR